MSCFYPHFVTFFETSFNILQTYHFAFVLFVIPFSLPVFASFFCSYIPTNYFFFLISYILPRRLNLTRKQHPAKISYPLCLVLKKLYRRPGLSASQTNPTSVFPCGVIFFPFLLAYFQYVCF